MEEKQPRQKPLDLPEEGPIPIGMVIKAKRFHLETNQAELAERVVLKEVGGKKKAMTGGYLSKIENGWIIPNDILLSKIAFALRLTLQELKEATNNKDLVEYWANRNEPNYRRIKDPVQYLRDLIDKKIAYAVASDLPDIDPTLTLDQITDLLRSSTRVKPGLTRELEISKEIEQLIGEIHLTGSERAQLLVLTLLQAIKDLADRRAI